jgi:hypothetical protein
MAFKPGWCIMRKVAKKELNPPEAFHVSMALVDESVRRDFGRHLTELLAQQLPVMSPSDLARKIFGDDDSGFAKGRDLVSKYLRGLTFPNNKTLDAIAKALGLSKMDVLPPSYRHRLQKNKRQNYIEEAEDGFFAIRIEGKVPHDSAMRIMELYLAGDNVYKAHIETQRKRGRS